MGVIIFPIEQTAVSSMSLNALPHQTLKIPSRPVDFSTTPLPLGERKKETCGPHFVTW